MWRSMTAILEAELMALLEAYGRRLFASRVTNSEVEGQKNQTCHSCSFILTVPKT